ncbi:MULTISPECIES: type 4a pilus biogenesis protein PilO [unclassified Luteimonas]|uniref:type 4a pilus biogenesis protein PilO n=1 Tax=unclassified Luteimonas TaxID=2629088 RepID=UPI001601F8F2|nr:type 4a pilus biogenesis protein PilO [Luteimonas sp. MC1825]MBB1473698.1 type 4a pilus biogenesis protein PilO [Luteimonas sp. MC1782]MBB6600087.1 type 4a pilus biogenesis protein PilO [Luteimonas sp. MC1825]QOC87787.1 type 4a pilus biogenesis protein PilO [Luteimonas sp. MC1825]
MSKRKMSLKELDFNNTGSWPREYKIAFCVLLGLLIFGLLWWVLTRDKGDQLKALEATESGLRADFETKQGRAANLEPLKLQLAEMEQQLQQMLRQLPSRTEMPDLIVDISQTALATGITSELFQPGPESPKEFYAEKPIALRMLGSYHQFGAFVSGVASLPRVVIMTMHDIQLRPKGGGDGKVVGIRPNSALELAGTVKTYRYLDDEEAAEQEKVAADAAKGSP